MSNTKNWAWFCGVNSSDLTSLSRLDNLQHMYDSACLLDGAYLGLQIIFVFLFPITILTLGCCTSYKKIQTPYLLRYPSHFVRWLLSGLLLIVLLASIAEGILTSDTHRTDQLNGLPHLYIAPIFGFFCTCLSLMFNQYMEVWRQPKMSWLLLIYWLASVTIEIFQVMELAHKAMADVMIVRFDVLVMRLVLYIMLALVELNVIRIKIFHYCHDFSSNVFPKELKSSKMRYYQQYSNAFSTGTFYWLNPLLKTGYKHPLTVDDLGTVPHMEEARKTYEEFRKAFVDEKARALSKGTMPSLWRVYFRVYGFRIITAFCLRLVSDALGLLGPVVIGGITLFAITLSSEQETPVPHFVDINEFFSNGFVLIIVAFLSIALKGLIVSNYMYWLSLEGIKLKSALQTMVYEKSLRLSLFMTNSGQMSIGQISNLMGVDAMQMFWTVVLGSSLFATPLVITATLVLLYMEMGVAALLGSLIIVGILPLQVYIARFMSRYQKEKLHFSDHRLKLSNELLHGIKLLKLYGWEEMYELAIEVVRRKELRSLVKFLFCLTITLGFVSVAPTCITLVAFAVYPSLSGESLRPDVAFSSLALFNQLMVPLWTLPASISNVVSAIVSTRRLNKFLVAPEVHEEEDQKNWQMSGEDGDEEEEHLEENRVTFHQDIGFRNSDGYTLLHNSTRTSPVAKEGHTTSLLSKVAGANRFHDYGTMEDTEILTSSLSKHGVSMQRSNSPVPASIAIQIENGCFSWDQDSLKPILSDIDVQIPSGKLTMIVGQVGAGKSSLLSAILGEMTIINGTVQRNSEKNQVAYAAQKAWLCNDTLRENVLFGQPMNEKRYKRVLDACALQPDIDILPAGDMTEIGEKGINLSGGQKQRVSVARAMYAAHNIVILDDPLSALDVHVGGHLFQEGIVGMLLKEKKTVILVTHQLQYLESADKILVLKDGCITDDGTFDEVSKSDPALHQCWRRALHLASESEAEVSGSESQSEVEREDLRKRVKLTKRNACKTENFDMLKEKGKLVEDEDIQRGSVSFRVYLFYLSCVSWVIIISLVAAVIANGAFQIAGSFWLSDWSDYGLQNLTSKNDYYVKGYAGLQLAGLCLAVCSVSLSMCATYIAAKKIHFRMLRNIIRVPLRFFDTTPIGRILNRYSSDTQLVDIRIGMTWNLLMGGTLMCTSAVLVNTIVSPTFLLLALPVAVIYFFIQRYYLNSSRELQRLDSVTKSPVFAYFSETLTGLDTIRAYKEQHRFFNTILERINTNVVTFLYLRTVMCWLGVRLDFLAAVVVLISGSTALFGASFSGTSSGQVGLSISWALSIASSLNILVRSSADLEIMMNAVERIKYYTNIENEDYDGINPPMSWPQYGEISIEGISARYAKGLDSVLKQVSVFIRAGEKVGICGRTGSGKSSLTLSLFRIIDMFEGHIVIDDIDIATVPLMTLRQKLSIIPQDPILFIGTIRYNLDPEGLRSDDELWEAIEVAQVRDVVLALPQGLDYLVTEGGENFSMGQRQLFCLARAFLRKSRILIMDEATASIDMETDKTLQKVVSTAFADRTVLTIAHRVTTILNCDSILVLSDGKVVEYDSPDHLLAREDSLFAALVKAKK